MTIVSRNPPSDACVRAVWVSWMFLFPVQPGCLPLVERLPRQKMDEDSAPQAPVAVGPEKGHLVGKLPRRNRMAGGSRMVRKCVRPSFMRRLTCAEFPEGSPELHAPKLFCPVCSFWEDVCRRVGAGGKLFPGITEPSLTGKPRSAARLFGLEGADRLGTHSVRRGAARSIVGNGGGFAQLFKADRWRSSAYRFFLDSGRGRQKIWPPFLSKLRTT